MEHGGELNAAVPNADVQGPILGIRHQEVVGRHETALELVRSEPVLDVGGRDVLFLSIPRERQGFSLDQFTCSSGGGTSERGPQTMTLSLRSCGVKLRMANLSDGF